MLQSGPGGRDDRANIPLQPAVTAGMVGDGHPHGEVPPHTEFRDLG